MTRTKKINTAMFMLIITLCVASVAHSQGPQVIGHTIWHPPSGWTGKPDIKWMKVLGEATNPDYYDVEYSTGERDIVWRAWVDRAVAAGMPLDYDPEARKKEQEKVEAARRIALIKSKKWPPAVERAVLAGKIQLGMTREQVTFSQGEPKWVNRTVTRNGTREQWVYRGEIYLYFDNGTLTAYQD